MSKTIACTLLSMSIILYCNQTVSNNTIDKPFYRNIDSIPVPPGYERITVEAGSFSEWLRRIKLKEDRNVYLYNGSLKPNQSAQFAVLDITVGHKDLQQCADAILRLRAEYLFSRHKTTSIAFTGTDGTALSFSKWLGGTRYKLNGNRLMAYPGNPSQTDTISQLKEFLEVVFSYCGTYSLAKETTAVYDISAVQPGDMFVKPGSPGHAMIVMDVAINHKGEKILMLAQSYMPAQDIHIVKNPKDKGLSPWYKAGDALILTPEWVFQKDQLKRWE